MNQNDINTAYTIIRETFDCSLVWPGIEGFFTANLDIENSTQDNWVYKPHITTHKYVSPRVIDGATAYRFFGGNAFEQMHKLPSMDDLNNGFVEFKDYCETDFPYSNTDVPIWLMDIVPPSDYQGSFYNSEFDMNPWLAELLSNEPFEEPEDMLDFKIYRMTWRHYCSLIQKKHTGKMREDSLIVLKEVGKICLKEDGQFIHLFSGKPVTSPTCMKTIPLSIEGRDCEVIAAALGLMSESEIIDHLYAKGGLTSLKHHIFNLNQFHSE